MYDIRSYNEYVLYVRFKSKYITQYSTYAQDLKFKNITDFQNTMQFECYYDYSETAFLSTNKCVSLNISALKV